MRLVTGADIEAAADPGGTDAEASSALSRAFAGRFFRRDDGSWTVISHIEVSDGRILVVNQLDLFGPP